MGDALFTEMMKGDGFMKNKLMKIVALCIGALLCAERGASIPIKENVRNEILSQGYELMALKGVPRASTNLNRLAWTMPKSVVVNEIRFAVENTPSPTDYIMSTGGVVVAKGNVCRFVNADVARAFGFGAIATTDMLLQDFAQLIRVQEFDTVSNLIFLSRSESVSELKDVLIYKNILVGIKAETNTFNFAAAILNAGLQVEDRFSLSN